MWETNEKVFRELGNPNPFPRVSRKPFESFGRQKIGFRGLGNLNRFPIVTKPETEKGFRENNPFPTFGNLFFAFESSQRISGLLSEMDLGFQALGNLFGRFLTIRKSFTVFDELLQNIQTHL